MTQISSSADFNNNHHECSDKLSASAIVDKTIVKPCPPKLFPYKLNTNKNKTSSDST